MKYEKFLERTRFSKSELVAFAYGRLVDDPPSEFSRLPPPPFLMLDRVLAIGQNEVAGSMGYFFVALLVLGIGQSLGGPTGYAINPARDLGPRIMHFILPIPGKGGSDWEYSWIPVVGPIIGGVIGAFAAKAAFGL